MGNTGTGDSARDLKTISSSGIIDTQEIAINSTIISKVKDSAFAFKIEKSNELGTLTDVTTLESGDYERVVQESWI